MSDVEQQLREALARADEQVAALQRQHALVVAASQGSNADDEHDPEGSTIAFERAQVAALLERARRTGRDLARALDRLHDGTHGRCEVCGTTIAAGRLQARPDARTCIACASARGRGR
ncbi:TraR/DksA C4-type zinc finger protein [Quadrisphaera sp. DSM 44207]|uniref:TraR/DksA family transcriptional regulator n=1 Tax=Quadrisphaera sp. DSM 44207 TaxID=1881057 RepID=UPI000881EE56|nr:TraR/DksA C4-type zinc finger protein [Quadrisphaera sp. DSM 44207]SDQ48068.1 transcriptional regulator, TraR/DksA family [Quadrisphaera sp. DSM 44207]